MICCGNVCWTWGELTDFKMCHYFLELLLSAADDDEQCLFMLLLLKHALPPLLKMVKLAVVPVSSASGLRRISWNSSVLEGVCVQNQSCAYAHDEPAGSEDRKLFSAGCVHGLVEMAKKGRWSWVWQLVPLFCNSCWILSGKPRNS